MATVRVCGRCGFANVEGAASCQQCGVTLEPLRSHTEGTKLLGFRTVLLLLACIELPFAAIVTRGFGAPIAGDRAVLDFAFAFVAGWIAGMLTALFWLLIAVIVKGHRQLSRGAQFFGLAAIGFTMPFLSLGLLILMSFK